MYSYFWLKLLVLKNKESEASELTLIISSLFFSSLFSIINLLFSDRKVKKSFIALNLLYKPPVIEFAELTNLLLW
jgi:hypothetical protein